MHVTAPAAHRSLFAKGAQVVCQTAAPWVWRLFRWIEAKAGSRPIPLTATLHEELTPTEFAALLSQGPWVDTIVRVQDGLVLWQSGGPLRDHGTPQGWAGSRLPQSTKTHQVLQVVHQTKRPVSYAVTWEGIDYTGTAVPMSTTLGDVVVFRAVRRYTHAFELLADDGPLRKMQQLADEALLVTEHLHVQPSAPAPRTAAGG